MTAALLRVDALRFESESAAHGAADFFEAVSFTVAPGEQVALLGPRGSSRAALMRAVALLDRPKSGRIFLGEVELTRLPGAKLRAARREFPYVGGHPARSLPPRFTVADALNEPLRIHGLGTPAERRARAEAALAIFQMNRALLGQGVYSLSTTLRQMTCLARALSLEPRLLLAEAVVDYLEPAAGPALLDRLSAHCRAHGLAWLWTTADPALARRYSDRVLRLEDRRLLPA